MALKWYLARLRGMSAGEIAHRVVEKAMRAASRGRHEGWRRYAAPGAPPSLPGLREAVLAAGPAQRAAIEEAARGVLDGRFSALGLDWPRRDPARLFPPELWRLAPDTGRSWPGAESYCFDIDYRRTDAFGDVKYVWEVNRLQFLQPLAAQALLVGGEAEVAAVEAAILSWHAENPPFRGVGWASGIEVALRAISLIVAGSLCGERLSGEARERTAEILRASAFWLARFPSRFSSANNHLMAELAGRYLIAMAGHGPAGAARAVRAEIEREVLRQILPDGVGAEQTPSYAAFTAELALLCVFAARASGHPFGVEALARLERFSGFVSWLVGPDGTVPAIGDDDEGRAIAACQPEPDYVASVAAAIDGFVGRPSPLAAPPALRNLVLGQPAGVAPQPEGAETFAVGGYTVWRGARRGRALHLVFDHGPLGYLSIAAHGHADALSVWLAVDGRPVLVDPGTFLYQSGGAWRSWLRSTRAHNTLSVAGADQSAISGPFNWSHKAKGRLDLPFDGNRVVASHDGYEKRFGVRHERAVELTEGGLVIRDRLVGAGAPLPCEISFQLAPDLEATAEGDTVHVRRDGSPVLRLRPPTPEIEIARGGEPGEGGWVSPRFGLKVEADRIVWRGMVGEETVATILELDGS